MADDDIAALVARLEAEDAEMRLRAVRKLAEKTVCEEVVEGLVRALGDAEPNVRVEASRGIKQMGQAAVPFLIGALEDDNLALRRHAAMMLGTLGALSVEAAPVLRALLEDDIVGDEAERALRRIEKAYLESRTSEKTVGIVLAWVIVALFLGAQLSGTPWLMQHFSDSKPERISSGIALGWGLIGTVLGAILGGSRWGNAGVLAGGLGFGLAGSLIGTALGYMLAQSMAPLM